MSRTAGELANAVSNAAGVVSAQQALITSQDYNPATQTLETNWFQAFDVGVTNGTNLLTFYATDLAGNTSTTNFSFMLNYAAKTNPPVVASYWPLNGDSVTGTAFTLRGILGDFTASLSAQFVDASGDTNFVDGVVERNGLFWVEHAPLSPGVNYVTLTAVDAVGNTTVSNLTITNVTSAGSPVLSVDDFSGQLGGSERNVLTSVTGTVALTNYTLWVNGVEASQSGGTWSASSVPVGPGGTAVVEVRAIPNSDNGGNGTGVTAQTDGTPVNPTSSDSVAAQLQIDQPAFVYVQEYHDAGYFSSFDYSAYWTNPPVSSTWGEDAGFFTGGSAFSTTDGTGTNGYTYEWTDDSGGAIYTNFWVGDVTNTGVSFSPTGSWMEWNGGDLPSVMAEGFWSAQQSVPFLEEGASPPYYATHVASGTEAICSETILLTGGKGIPTTSQELYAISVAATNFTLEPGEEAFGGFDWGFATQAIPPAQLSIPGLPAPDTNGEIWTALAANQAYSATVQAGVQNYTYSVGQQEYKLLHQCVATWPTNQWRLTVGPEEQVNFYFSPALPTNVTWTGGSEGYCSPTISNLTVFTATNSSAGSAP